MATSVSLADLQAASQEKWGDFVIEDLGVTLRHALRLSKAERKKLSQLQDAESDGDEDEEVVLNRLRKTVEIVAQTPEQGKKLLAAVGDDVTLLATILEQYTEATQMGEASDSEN